MSTLTRDEEYALLDHLQEDPAALEEHIRSGGTYGGYVSAWKANRDNAARAVGISNAVARQVLALPLGDGYWGTPQQTVRDYLVELLAEFWAGNADPKYGMAGNSDWQYDLYGPLSRAGLIPGWKDGWGIGYHEDGSSHPEEAERANELIAAAIRALGSVVSQ